MAYEMAANLRLPDLQVPLVSATSRVIATPTSIFDTDHGNGNGRGR